MDAGGFVDFMSQILYILEFKKLNRINWLIVISFTSIKQWNWSFSRYFLYISWLSCTDLDPFFQLKNQHISMSKLAQTYTDRVLYCNLHRLHIAIFHVYSHKSFFWWTLCKWINLMEMVLCISFYIWSCSAHVSADLHFASCAISESVNSTQQTVLRIVCGSFCVLASTRNLKQSLVNASSFKL